MSVQLRDCSVLKNIILDLPYDPHKFESVLRTARAFDFVESLPLKEHTVIGEDGSLLSGGQLQRLSLAQSLYREPQILVYDEATSALDKPTEKEILDDMSKLNVTLIIVTHNPEMLTFCDKIINISSFSQGSSA